MSVPHSSGAQGLPQACAVPGATWRPKAPRNWVKPRRPRSHAKLPSSAAGQDHGPEGWFWLCSARRSLRFSGVTGVVAYCCFHLVLKMESHPWPYQPGHCRTQKGSSNPYRYRYKYRDLHSRHGKQAERERTPCETFQKNLKN